MDNEDILTSQLEKLTLVSPGVILPLNNPNIKITPIIKVRAITLIFFLALDMNSLASTFT